MVKAAQCENDLVWVNWGCSHYLWGVFFFSFILSPPPYDGLACFFSGLWEWMEGGHGWTFANPFHKPSTTVDMHGLGPSPESLRLGVWELESPTPRLSWKLHQTETSPRLQTQQASDGAVVMSTLSGPNQTPRTADVHLNSHFLECLPPFVKKVNLWKRVEMCDVFSL